MDINFDDLKQLQSLMDNADKYNQALSSRNLDKEIVMVYINKDKIITKTYQNNNWVCVHYYYRDGQREETFEK